MFLHILDNFCEDYANIIVFCLNLFVLFSMITVFFYIKISKRKWNRMNDYLGDISKTVNSIRYGDLTKKIETIDIPDSVDLSENINRMIETLHDREIMLTEYQNDLSKQNKILVEIINSLSDGLMVIDEHNKILRASERISEWFNVDGTEIVGNYLSDFIGMSRKKPVNHWNNDEVFIPTNKSLNFSASTVELKNVEDKKKQYVVILKNITDQKELETLKEDFVATLTHDLKVPIIAETNMIDLFLSGNFGAISEKQKVALKNMQTSNKELLDLVQIVLETYKIKGGKMALYKENIMLISFINEIIEEMSPIANKAGNKLNFIKERDIRVFADRFQLKRIIKNLIQNAIAHGKAKTPIDIRIGEIPNYIAIFIKDYGGGISKEEAEKIFNKYYSAGKKFRKIGTGLGLYLALQIANAHRGDLTVNSTEGEFTEFCIKIPAHERDDEHSFIRY